MNNVTLNISSNLNAKSVLLQDIKNVSRAKTDFNRTFEKYNIQNDKSRTLEARDGKKMPENDVNVARNRVNDGNDRVCNKCSLKDDKVKVADKKEPKSLDEKIKASADENEKNSGDMYELSDDPSMSLVNVELDEADLQLCEEQFAETISAELDCFIAETGLDEVLSDTDITVLKNVVSTCNNAILSDDSITTDDLILELNSQGIDLNGISKAIKDFVNSIKSDESNIIISENNLVDITKESLIKIADIIASAANDVKKDKNIVSFNLKNDIDTVLAKLNKSADMKTYIKTEASSISDSSLVRNELPKDIYIDETFVALKDDKGLSASLLNSTKSELNYVISEEEIDATIKAAKSTDESSSFKYVSNHNVSGDTVKLNNNLGQKNEGVSLQSDDLLKTIKDSERVSNTLVSNNTITNMTAVKNSLNDKNAVVDNSGLLKSDTLNPNSSNHLLGDKAELLNQADAKSTTLVNNLNSLQSKNSEVSVSLNDSVSRSKTAVKTDTVMLKNLVSNNEVSSMSVKSLDVKPQVNTSSNFTLDDLALENNIAINTFTTIGRTKVVEQSVNSMSEVVNVARSIINQKNENIASQNTTLGITANKANIISDSSNLMANASHVGTVFANVVKSNTLKSSVGNDTRGIDIGNVETSSATERASVLNATNTTTASSITSRLNNTMGGLFSFFDNKLPLSTNNQNQNAQNITNKVLEMAARNLQQVELELNPQNLGKMKIKIDINDAKNASVSFMVNNATTKELLSGSFDKLKAALEDVGYQLTEQNVTQHNAEDTGTNSNREFNNSEWRKEVLATSKSMHNSKEWMNAFTQEMKI
jgi:hypothetical protein